MSTPPTDTGPDFAARLVQVALDAIERNTLVLHHRWETEARAVVVAVLRELVERPRHGGPHMYCRSEGELRGLIDEIEGVDRA